MCVSMCVISGSLEAAPRRRGMAKPKAQGQPKTITLANHNI